MSIQLVSSKSNCCLWRCKKTCIFKPRRNMAEAFSACDVENKQNSSSSSVITSCDRTETFLSSSVPNLEFYTFVVNFNNLWAKFNTDCVCRVLLDCVWIKKNDIAEKDGNEKNEGNNTIVIIKREKMWKIKKRKKTFLKKNMQKWERAPNVTDMKLFCVNSSSTNEQNANI